MTNIENEGVPSEPTIAEIVSELNKTNLPEKFGLFCQGERLPSEDKKIQLFCTMGNQLQLLRIFENNATTGIWTADLSEWE